MEKPPSGSGWKYDDDPLAEIDDIYQSLIETVHILDPNYRSPSNEANTSNSQPHRRGIPWTKDEHRLFLMRLNKYGKGDWKGLSRYYVMSKTPTQVASHAQKYFRRHTCSTPLDKCRPSIHDIQDVNHQLC